VIHKQTEVLPAMCRDKKPGKKGQIDPKGVLRDLLPDVADLLIGSAGITYVNFKALDDAMRISCGFPTTSGYKMGLCAQESVSKFKLMDDWATGNALTALTDILNKILPHMHSQVVLINRARVPCK
jgi:hypothetical protein